MGTHRSGAITVVVVSFNSAADLPDCLKALSAADDVSRVLVVDNASTDTSRELVASFAEDGIELLPLPTNTGFAGGCNHGFAAVADDCRVIACVNPDVVVAPDCLARAADALAADPELAGVAPRLMRPDGETVDSVGQVLNGATLEVRDRGYGERLGPELLARRPVLAACGALAVFRRSALAAVSESAGPWAEHYFCFWEDLELGWRLTNAGSRIDALPDAVAVHGRGAGAAVGPGPLRWRRSTDLEACVITNRWMTLIRHLPTLDLSLRLPLLLTWDVLVTTAGVARRPRLASALARRWPLVLAEWRARHGRPRRRLRDLPW